MLGQMHLDPVGLPGGMPGRTLADSSATTTQDAEVLAPRQLFGLTWG
jgi:hypothetical protein